MSKKLTVIIPVHNGEDYIQSCIFQLRYQTYKDFKCIIVNDGSTDQTGKIVAQEILNDESFELINIEKNKGVSYARNLGFSKAKSEYVMFIDSDDTFSTELFQKMIDVIEKQDSDFAVCDHANYKIRSNIYVPNMLMLNYFPLNKPFNSDDVVNLDNFSLESFSAVIWNKIFKRKFLLENKIIFDEKISIGEDLEFSVRALILAKKISLLPTSLYTYRTEVPGNSQESFDQHPMDLINAVIAINELIKSKNLDTRYYDLYKLLASEKLTYLVMNCNPKNQREIMSNSKKIFKDLDLDLNIDISNKFTKELLRSIYENDFDSLLVVRDKYLKNIIVSMSNTIYYIKNNPDILKALK